MWKEVRNLWNRFAGIFFFFLYGVFRYVEAWLCSMCRKYHLRNVCRFGEISFSISILPHYFRRAYIFLSLRYSSRMLYVNSTTYEIPLLLNCSHELCFRLIVFPDYKTNNHQTFSKYWFLNFVTITGSLAVVSRYVWSLP